MIDINYLNEFPKMFVKESSQLKQILNIFNEMKAEITYIKSTVEIELKSQEGLSRNIITAAKNFSSESLSNTTIEDLTYFFKIEQYFITLFDQISNEQLNSTSHYLVQKTFTQISDDISDFTKGSYENINALVKDLNNARIKYKNFYQKLEKSYRELELNFMSKKKIDNDDKNSYNQTMKDKIDDKILNILNEFEENKLYLNLAFDECKRLEVVLNEFIKSLFVNSIRFILNSIKNFKTFLDEICESKTNILNKMKSQFISEALVNLNNTEFNFENQEIRLNDLRGIKNDFVYLLNLFNSNDNSNDNSDDNCNDKTQNEFNLDDHFNKNNFHTSTLTDNLLSYIYTFQQLITSRKRQLNGLNKFVQDFIKNNENFISLSNKLIKNLSVPKLTILTNLPFLIQIQEFLRSLFELIIRKEEEYTKIISQSLQTQLEHTIIKDINTDEIIINGLFQKIQKEYSSFKYNLNKLLQNKEKVSLNLEKVKENIQKTSDDVNSFSKFEKQFLSLRTEEGNLNEACLELYRKYKKFIEEILEILKKSINSYREKEITKSKELKESLIHNIKSKEKNFNQISEFLVYCVQISFTEEIITKSVKTILGKFNKDFDLNITDELIDSIIPNIQCDNESAKKEIQNLLNDIVFINKEEIVMKKEMNLLEFFTSEELESYKNKLNFLKNNSRKISLKNFHVNRKMYEDIFYVDEDENVISNFSCALSDKILLQGKLYITNKKLVFHSWFNNSTLFGKTLIEIPKEEIVEVDKHKNLLFDNMIYVRTKTTQFLFASIIYREKCYNLIREVVFGEENPNSIGNKVIENENINQNINENINENINQNIDNFLIEETKSNEIPLHGENEINSIPSPIKYHLKDILEKNQFFEKMRNLQKNRINDFNTENKRTFQNVILHDYKLGNIPLNYIYESIFNPYTIYENNKNFFISYCESRTDFNFILSKTEEENWVNKIPDYITNKDDYIFKIYKNEQNLKDFIESESNRNEYEKIEFKYNYSHPILKKKFMGPSRLEVEDCFKIYFIAPNVLIVEVFSYLSGFMMMDTFYSILQYKFVTDFSYDDLNKKMNYDTKMTISFGIEFVKDNWFKSKIVNEAMSDMDESIKTLMLPRINKVLDSQKEKFMNSYRNYLDKVEDNILELEPVDNINNYIENNLPQDEIMQEEIRIEEFVINDMTNQFKFENNLEENKIIPSTNINLNQNEINLIDNEYIKLFKNIFKTKENIYAFILSLVFILILFIPFYAVILFCFNLIIIYLFIEKINRVELRLNNLQEEILELNKYINR